MKQIIIIIRKTILSLLSFFMCVNMVVTTAKAQDYSEEKLTQNEPSLLYEIENKRSSYEKHVRKWLTQDF